MMLIAESNINIVESKKTEPGSYRLSYHKPVFNTEWHVFEDLTTFRPLFNVFEGEPAYALSPMGYGACKLQTLSIGMARVRDTMLKRFNQDDIFCFANKTEEKLDLSSFIKVLLSHKLDTGYTTCPIKRIKNKIARLKLNPCRVSESILLDLVLGQPYGDNGKWWCPYQILPNEPRAVMGEDSYRALRMAFSLLAKWSLMNLDDSWKIRYLEQGKVKQFEYTEMLGAVFRGTLPDLPLWAVARMKEQQEEATGKGQD